MTDPNIRPGAIVACRMTVLEVERSGFIRATAQAGGAGWFGGLAPPELFTLLEAAPLRVGDPVMPARSSARGVILALDGEDAWVALEAGDRKSRQTFPLADLRYASPLPLKE